MQLIRPDMYPFIAGLILLFLALVGILGMVFLYLGWKSYKQRKRTTFTLFKIVSGVLCLGFVLYNWIGYRVIYAENESLIVGKYVCPELHLNMRINADHTWETTGNGNYFCKKGTWEYIPSEDWCYWNIESENGKCRAQTGSSEMIRFKEHDLTFVRTTHHDKGKRSHVIR